jgi:hypothetical protein
MTVALARFVRTGVGKERVPECEIEALGTTIRFAFEGSKGTLSITAAHSAGLPITYAENWLTEPLRILFGQLLFPRLVARNYGDGRATVWVRRTPGLITTARWTSLLGNDSSVPDDDDFWRLYVQLLTFVAQAKDERGEPNFQTHKVTRLYEEVAQASRGSRWVWALTFASSIEALVKMIIPTGLAQSDSETGTSRNAIAALTEHIAGYLPADDAQARLKNLALNAVRRDNTINTSRAMRTLEAMKVITKTQVAAWIDIRNSVMHGSLLSPYSNEEEDRKLLQLASMMHALTRELIRRSVVEPSAS